MVALLGLHLMHDDLPVAGRRYYTFYNSADYPFSNFYPATVELEGAVYKTGEHYWQASKYFETEPALAAKITAAETVDEGATELKAACWLYLCN